MRLNFSFVFLRFPLGRSPGCSCAHASVPPELWTLASLHRFSWLFPSKRSYDFSSVETKKCKPPCNRKFSLVLSFFFFFSFLIQSDTGATPPESCIFGLMTFITSYAGTSPLDSSCEPVRFASVMWLCEATLGFPRKKRTKLSQEKIVPFPVFQENESKMYRFRMNEDFSYGLFCL